MAAGEALRRRDLERRRRQLRRLRIRAEGLSPEAKAFQAKLAASRDSPTSAFAEWRGSRRGQLTLTWVLTLMFLSPSLISFLTGASLMLSIGLGVVGFLVNGWLRRVRRRRLRQIVAWEAPADGPGGDA